MRAGEPAARFFAAPGGGAAGRQIEQFSMKRLWRQKLGGTSPHSRARRAATFGARATFERSPGPRHAENGPPVPARSRILLTLAVVASSAAGAPAASAAWTAPQTIVADRAASGVGGAGNRHGSEAFVWKVTSGRVIHAGGLTAAASWVRARVRLPDGRRGRVQTISSTRGVVATPQIGVDEAGNVTAVWTQAGRHLAIMAAFRPHGGRFGAPAEIGRSQHFNDARPALAGGRFGDAVVAWNEGRSVQVVRRGPPACTARRARACFSAPIALRRGSDQAVAIGPLGSAYVVWAAEVRTGADVHTRLRMTVLRRSGRRLGQEHFLSASGDAGQPSLAVLRDGTALVAWRASLPAGGEQNDPAPIVAVASTPDAVAGAPQTVSAGRGELPQLRVGAQGEAVLAWDGFDPTPGSPDGPRISAAVRPAGAAAFGPATTLSPAGVAAGFASLAVDAAGSAYVVYSAAAPSASGPVALSHVRPPGGAFGAPIALAPGFSGLTVLAAGARVTAVSGAGSGGAGRTLVSDWTP
ncbi:MAG: hypothetical protein QOE11_3327 [Solirubrobacteraceae bacterium]|nr:hypothetical protein [Solirubrobacteraceae bacterium]